MASASTAWREHYIIQNCPICMVGVTDDENQFCPEGAILRRASIADALVPFTKSAHRSSCTTPGCTIGK